MTFATTLLAMVWLALPGLLHSLRKPLPVEYHAASATASIVSMALIAALSSVVLSQFAGHSISSWLPLATTLPFVVHAAYSGRAAGLSWPKSEWQALLPALVVLLMGAYTYHIGYAVQPDGSLDAHAWYNADWFKHLGHAHAVANLGLPARDIFGGGGPLHYYWLFYVIPGAASAISGDAAGSLYWANHVVAALFWILLYGLVRRTGATAWQTALLLIAAVTLFSVEATVNWLHSGLSMLEFPKQFQPSGPVLISMGLYIPQHTLMISILMAWMLGAYLPPQPASPPVRWMMLASLAAAGAVSTLFGALCLVVYGLAQLAMCRRANWRSIILELACTGIAAIAIVLVLDILDPAMGGHAISSPLFESEGSRLSFLQRLFITTVGAIASLGPAMLFGVAMLARWNKAQDSKADPLLVLAMIALLVGLAGTILPEAIMDNLRLARELRIRSPYLAALAALVGIGWGLAQMDAGRFRPVIIYGLLAACLLLALPGGFMRIIWHGTKGPEFFTHIPADDMKAMAHLSTNADREAIIWQFPEAPELADDGGDDTWVPILAGRILPASLRATNYPRAAPELAEMQRFFNGAAQAVPAHVDWIYLSRTLHPQSYTRLVRQLSADRQWTAAYCPADACLFKRISSEGRK